MKNKLRFDLHLKPHSFPESPNVHLEAWGTFIIELLADEKPLKLFELDWDVVELIEWFVENQSALCQEIFSFQGKGALPDESLAQALERLYSIEIEDDELEFQRNDALYWYGRRHDIASAFFGVKLPPIIIGCNHGTGEISSVDSSGFWAYEFDMSEFCADTQQKMRVFLSTWLATAQNDDVRGRANSLLNGLQMHVQGCCQ